MLRHNNVIKGVQYRFHISMQGFRRLCFMVA